MPDKPTAPVLPVPMSPVEIARALGVSHQYVNATIERAMAKLAVELILRGYKISELV